MVGALIYFVILGSVIVFVFATIGVTIAALNYILIGVSLVLLMYSFTLFGQLFMQRWLTKGQVKPSTLNLEGYVLKQQTFTEYGKYQQKKVKEQLRQFNSITINNAKQQATLNKSNAQVSKTSLNKPKLNPSNIYQKKQKLFSKYGKH